MKITEVVLNQYTKKKRLRDQNHHQKKLEKCGALTSEVVEELRNSLK